jgi:hypothetical protein
MTADERAALFLSAMIARMARRHGIPTHCNVEEAWQATLADSPKACPPLPIIPIASRRCVTPGCNRVRETRGLCGTCYRRQAYHVTHGHCTWHGLEALGKSVPPVRGA